MTTDSKKSSGNMVDKKILFDITDGPEGIEVYTSEQRGIVDWSSDLPALYINVAINGANVQMGPFQMKSIRERFERLAGLEAAAHPLDLGSK